MTCDTELKFHSSGREDVDVRMLGSGTTSSVRHAPHLRINLCVLPSRPSLHHRVH